MRINWDLTHRIMDVAAGVVFVGCLIVLVLVVLGALGGCEGYKAREQAFQAEQDFKSVRLREYEKAEQEQRYYTRQALDVEQDAELDLLEAEHQLEDLAADATNAKQKYEIADAVRVTAFDTIQVPHWERRIASADMVDNALWAGGSFLVTALLGAGYAKKLKETGILEGVKKIGKGLEYARRDSTALDQAFKDNTHAKLALGKVLTGKEQAALKTARLEAKAEA